MADETDGKSDESGAGKDEKGGSGGGDGAEKRVPLKDLIQEREARKKLAGELSALQARLDEAEGKGLSEVEKLTKQFEVTNRELETTRKELETFKVRDEKMKLFAKAKGKMGENFTLEGREEGVLAAIDSLAFNPESAESAIRNIVELAKQPKGSAKSPIGAGKGGDGGGTPKKAGEYTGKELQDLQRDDPDRFKEVMNERKNASAFPARPVMQSAGAAK